MIDGSHKLPRPGGDPLKRIRVVMVHPQGPSNIGSVARAMKNMGVRELGLVRGAKPEDFWAKAMAVHATDVLENAKRFATLREAVADCALVVGTTSREGLYRSPSEPPRKLAPRILRAALRMPVALVFGPEDHGLTNTDIRHCHWLMRIPTHPHYPSLNVAQAVMICLYEVFLASQTKRVRATSRDRAPTEQVEKLYDRMRETLLKIGFLNPQNPEHILLGLRRIFGRAGLGEKEVHILEGLFHQIGWYAETGPKLPTRSSAQARQKKP